MFRIIASNLSCVLLLTFLIGGPSHAADKEALLKTPNLPGDALAGRLPKSLPSYSLPMIAPFDATMIIEADQFVGRLTIQGKSQFTRDEQDRLVQTDRVSRVRYRIASKGWASQSLDETFFLKPGPLITAVFSSNRKLEKLERFPVHLQYNKEDSNDRRRDLGRSIPNLLHAFGEERYRYGLNIDDHNLHVGNTEIFPHTFDDIRSRINEELLPALRKASGSWIQNEWIAETEKQLHLFDEFRRFLNIKSNISIQGARRIGGRDYLEISGPFEMKSYKSSDEFLNMDSELLLLVDQNSGIVRYRFAVVKIKGTGIGKVSEHKTTHIFDLNLPHSFLVSEVKPASQRANDASNSATTPLAMSGPSGLIVGSIEISAEGGVISASNAGSSCQGQWQRLSSDETGSMGTWSLSCRDGFAAAGQLQINESGTGRGTGHTSEGDLVSLQFQIDQRDYRASSPMNRAIVSSPKSDLNVQAAPKELEVDGRWSVELTFDANSAPTCVALDFSKGFFIDRRRVRGIVSHPYAGVFHLTGKIGIDGELENVRAVGSDTVDFEGSLNQTSGNGTWSTRRSDCRGTWQTSRS